MTLDSRGDRSSTLDGTGSLVVGLCNHNDLGGNTPIHDRNENMARYIPVGTPVNRAEVEGLRQLRDRLPDNYIVIGNFELDLQQRRNTLEFDVVVIGDWGVYAVEIKGWSGKIRGDTRRWTLQWGKVENPFIRAETKAKALRDLLARNTEGWPDALYVESVVHLPSKKLRIKLDDPRERRLVLRDGVEAFFIEEASRAHEDGPEVVRIDDALKERIVEQLVPLATPTNQLPNITNYEVIEELDLDGLPFREFIGHHTLLRSRGKVRIKRYSMDPLIAPSKRDDEIARVLRDMEVLNTMDDNPYIARAYELIRDMEDELIFYVVTEHASNTTLRDIFDEEREPYQNCLPEQRHLRWRLAWHITKAIASTHKRGVTHRNLHPGVIYITDEDARVPVKIADFDFARIGNFDLVSDMLRQIVKQGYGAPEMWLEDVHDHRVDTYSIGALLFELLTGTPLYTSSMALMRHNEIWDMRRELLPDEEARKVWDKLLAYNPDERFNDLHEILPFIAERAGGFTKDFRPLTGDYGMRGF